MKRPIVCFFGADAPTFQNGDLMTLLSFPTDENIDHIATLDPDVVVTIGESWNKFPNLSTKINLSKWFHCSDIKNVTLASIYHCYINNLSKNIISLPRENMPLISCFCPSYDSSGKINRPYRSLRAQTYPYWEWIIINDQPHSEENCKVLRELEESDARIRVYGINSNTGNIGQHKFETASLARGKYLAELDHDDDLTPDCLEMIKGAFDQHPKAGFAYTDFAELYEKDLAPYNYGHNWAFGFGGYYAQMTKIPGVEEPVLTHVARSANINEFTMANIVGVPNHIRVWEKDLYFKIGGHNPLAVGDDYELIIRTFLNTRMVRIPYLGYYQYRNQSGNTTFKRLPLITLIQGTAYNVYKDRIQARLDELGIKQQNHKDRVPVWEQDYIDINAAFTYKKEDKETIVIITYQGRIACETAIKNAMKKDCEICIVGNGVSYLDDALKKYRNDPRIRWWNLHKTFDDDGVTAKKYADYNMVRTGNPVYIYA